MREHRILRAIPFILLAVITLGMSLVGYDGYRRAHVKPKPSPMIPANPRPATTALAQDGHPCRRLDSGWWACGDPNTVWFQCNAGMAVTHPQDCPEHHPEMRIRIVDEQIRVTIHCPDAKVDNVFVPDVRLTDLEPLLEMAQNSTCVGERLHVDGNKRKGTHD